MAAENDIDKLVLAQFFTNDGGMFRPGGWLGRQRVIVDVGAAGPDYLSISAGFRSRGWKVVAVEPNPKFCEAHRSMGYDIHQYACSDRDEDDQDFIVVDSQGSNYHGGVVSNESFSSLGIEGKFADLLETVRGKTSTSQIKVDVRKLDTILSCHEPSIRKIDVLAVDVEGWELKVMDGFSIERYQPSVVILENLFEDPDYHDAMRRRGFELWRRVEPNDIYVNATRSKQGQFGGTLVP